jgi:hypothetical protein
VIVVAVRWYLRFNLSYRDVEELLVERGIEVDHVTVYRWVQRFTPLLADVARFCRHSPGDRWFVDETYVKVNGVWRYVYRAIDQYGQLQAHGLWSAWHWLHVAGAPTRLRRGLDIVITRLDLAQIAKTLLQRNLCGLPFSHGRH